MDTLPLRLPLEDLHLLGTAGQHTRDHGNEHHDDKRQREARQGKADLPIRHGEYIVHTQHAGNGDQDTEQVAVRQQRRQEYIQKEDHRHIAGIAVGVHRPQQHTQQHRGKEKRHGNNEISAGIQQRFVKYLSLFGPLPRPWDLPFLHMLPSPRRFSLFLLYCITDSC